MNGSGAGAARRRRAVALAGHTGDEAVARRALADPDPAVRATALGALERLGILADAEVMAALDDPEAGVRRRAAEVAARHPRVSFVGALADDAYRGRRRGGGVGVLASRPNLAPRPCRSWPADARWPPITPDPLVREAAVASLGAIGDPAGLPAILAAGTDKPAIRRRAVLALAPFDGPDVDAALARARDDRDWQVRQAAEDLSEAGAIWAGDEPAP